MVIGKKFTFGEMPQKATFKKLLSLALYVLINVELADYGFILF